MGMHALDVIAELAGRGLFRERDLTARGVSHSWLATAQNRDLVTRCGHGVWSHKRYEPTRYELVQIRFPKAVFWGPSALWLHGAEAHEPEALWIAIANKSRVPGTLDRDAVILRTRHLERELVTLRPEKRFLTLRLHSRERARADVARINAQRVLERVTARQRIEMPRDSCFLSSGLPTRPRWLELQLESSAAPEL